MKTIIFLFSSLFYVVCSCERNESNSTQYAGEIYTMSSGKGNGFSFEQQPQQVKNPDFLIVPQKDITGDVLTPLLAHPDLENRFYLLSEFESYTSAQTCFNSTYIRLPETDSLKQFATNLKRNQIWIVRTKNGSYGKLWILDYYSNRSKESPYARLRFHATLAG